MATEVTAENNKRDYQSRQQLITNARLEQLALLIEQETPAGVSFCRFNYYLFDNPTAPQRLVSACPVGKAAMKLGFDPFHINQNNPLRVLSYLEGMIGLELDSLCKLVDAGECSSYAEAAAYLRSLIVS